MPVLESPIKIPMKLEVTPDGIKMGLGNTVMPRTVIIDDELSLESENPVQNKVITAALNEKVDSEGAAAAAPVQSVSGKTGDVELVKSDVGLGNVDNTSDLDKPVSTAQAQALDGKLSKTGGSMTGPIAMGGNKITGLQQGTADADAVNVAQMASAISQGAAYFRGSFATKADLLAVAWQTSDPEAANYVTNNDYAIVLADETHSNECWRYLYVSGDGWTAQYRINESPFTQAQLDAINSGATQALISAIPGKQDTLTFDTEPTYNSTNPVTSDGIHVALDKKTTYEDLYGVYPLMYSSGSENEFADGADDIPFESFKVTINPVQNGSGIPSPTNVRAISGWAEVRVYHETEETDGNPNEYIVNLAPYVPGGVVYSGVLDLINWKLTVNRVAVDLGSLSWSKTGTKFYHPWDSEDPLKPDANATPGPVGKAADALCSQYEASSYTALATKDYGFTLYKTLGTSRVYVTDSRYSTTDAFKAGVNGVTLVYPLATPIVYDISDYNYEFKSAYGLNIITATTGDNEVEYRAALELILAKTDQNFASVEVTKKASKNYSYGDLIVVQHRLYRAISSIANKQPLVPGVNISETNIETEIINSNEFTKVEYGASYNDVGRAITESQRSSKPVVYYNGGFCYFLTDYDNTEDAFVFTWSGKDDIVFWKCNRESVWSSGSRPIGTYSKPDSGIPKTDLDSSVQSSLDKADSAYQKPSNGIPKTALASGVQSSLDLAYSAYQKPSGGIPATDLASGVIPAVPSASSATPQDLGTAAAGSSNDYSRADHVHNKPTYSKSDVGLGNVDNVQQYSASNPPPYPVDEEDLYDLYPISEASGSIASFSDGADSMPVSALSIAIDPVQSGSGDPAPDNVRPISGWTQAEIFHTGKNMYGDSYFELDGKYAELHGIHTPSTADATKKLYGVYLKGGQTYRIYIDFGATKQFGVYAARTGLSTQIQVASNASRSKYNATYTPTYDGWYCFWLYSSGGWSSFTKADFTVQIYADDEAYSQTYPYVGTSFTIDLDGTIYGGTLDVLTGVLTVTMASIASYAGESINEPWLSSMDKYVSGATPTTGAQVVYPLSAPQTYQLSPTEVSTLLGANNIWSDTGDISVYYRSDPTLRINRVDDDVISVESMITGVEDSMVATKNYSVGALLIANKTLYNVTATIANGSAIVPGTNVTATTVEAVISAAKVSPYASNPAALGTASPGSSANYARGDHVHTKPTYTASDVGAVAVAQGVAHAGEFVVVGSDGNITTVTMAAWAGGSY